MPQHADLLAPRTSDGVHAEDPEGERLFFVLGAAFAGLAILIGAFGAHALRGHVSADRYDDFVAGIVLFSGSLYLLGVTGQRWLGAITPIGGLAFIAGWALLARQVRSAGRRTRTTG